MNKDKVAILFFGLTRSLSTTISSFKQHIFNSLSQQGFDYDIFIHTYIIDGQYDNKWSGEKTNCYINENIHELLPKRKKKIILTDSQQHIVNRIDFNKYYSNLGSWTGMTPDMTKYLIKNMILALYSKYRITKEFEKVKQNYKYVIITRPDMMYTTDLPLLRSIRLHSQNIIIPEKDWYGGCNDRMCICIPQVAIYYGSAYKYLLSYSKRYSIVSEKYMKDLLERKNINIETLNINYDTIRINYV